MELKCVFAISVLGIVGFAGMVSGICLVRNTDEPHVYWYQCSLSDNYLADVEAAPIDISKLTFSNSKFPVIEDKSFARLGNKLKTLEIGYSEIGEIKDNAFQGLVNLYSLKIFSSNLKVVKGAWFKGLTNLKRISFQANKIENIESSFFSIVPPLELLDVFENRLNCIAVDSFGNFRTNEFQLGANPLSLQCLVNILRWFEDKHIHHDYTGNNNMDVPTELLDKCVKKLTTDNPGEVLLRKCIEDTAMEYLLPQANYTTKGLCEHSEIKPSPFLDCTP